MEVYAPATVAQRCFLSEALMWVLAGHVPLVENGAESVEEDERFNGDFDDYGGYYVDILDAVDAASQTIGIRQNPARDVDQYGLDGVSFHVLDVLDEEGGSESSHFLKKMVRERCTEEEISEAPVLKADYDLWLEEVGLLLERPKAQIISAILMGEIPVYCDNEAAKISDDDEYYTELFIEPESNDILVPAPISIIRAASLDWQRSISEIGRMIYGRVCVDTHALMKALPFSGDGDTVNVQRMGNVLMMERAQGSVAAPAARRGRKPMPWAQMHRELGRMIERGAVPKKKEALIAELMHWCQTAWGRQVSRSAIQAQLKEFDPAGN